jgi:thiamine kinase-like enzyme
LYDWGKKVKDKLVAIKEVLKKGGHEEVLKMVEEGESTFLF